ncbi:sporulation protein YpjB [Paenibacillus beijingensis]|uniref:Sporulation protein n=1 Tax=Paenibacillus beijingensis TaxID=1126833 RepID=A0A0D5NPR9_9BACL|nr:sporulation protein YpjB [Paenibacillus beijingensis]AJY77145.1 hypothetical protein VN24_24605 [Paenibacillus beijingensis]
MPKRRPWIIMMLCAALLAVGALRGAYAEPAAGRTEPNTTVRKFQMTSGKLYELVKYGNRQQSYYALRDTKMWLKQPALRMLGTEEGWSALEKSLERGERAFTIAGSGSGDNGLTVAASQIRLASDALANPDSPLWQEYKGIVLEDLGRLSNAWKSRLDGQGGGSEGHAEMSLLAEHWTLLKPAALMTRPRQTVEEVEEKVGYTARLLQHANNEHFHEALTMQAIQSLESSMKGLFEFGTINEKPVIAADFPAASPPFWIYVIVWFVSAVLALVGWRNYRGGQNGVLIYPRKKQPEQKLGVVRK